MLLGVRPEAITPDRGEGQPGSTFTPVVAVVEPTGADNLAFLALGGSEVIGRLPPGRDRAGERVLLFDPASERRVD